MGRHLPDLARTFTAEVNESLELVLAVEEARTRLSPVRSQQFRLTTARVQLAYELSYLRSFALWETFLEETFVRYLCGYESASGPERPVATYCSTLSSARTMVLGSKSYLLWHNPSTVITRAKQYFISGHHETVIDASLSRLNWFAQIRHRVAHEHEDARRKFDGACMALCGRRFKSSRPGALLREWASTPGSRTRWLEVITKELSGLAYQIAPV